MSSRRALGEVGRVTDAEALDRVSARGGAATIVAQLISMIIRIAGMVILARLIVPEIFGIAAIAVAIATVGAQLIYLGLPMATAQASQLGIKGASSLLLINTALGLAVSALLLALSEPAGRFFGDERLGTVLAWVALVPLVSGFQAQFRLNLVRRLRFSALAVSDALGQLIGSGAAIVLALLDRPVAAVISQSLVFVVIQSGIVISAARWVPSWPGAWRSEVAPILRVGLSVLGANLLREGSRNSIVPLLGTQVSSGAVGNFDRAQQLSVVPVNLTVDQLQRVTVPVIARLREEPPRVLRYMRKAQLPVLYATGTGYLLLAVLGDLLIAMLLGGGWELAGTVIQILALGAVFRALGNMSTWVFIGTGNAAAAFRMNLWAQPLVLLVSSAGLAWGVIGVAIFNSLAWFLYWPAATVLASRAAGYERSALIRQAMRPLITFGLPVALAAFLARVLVADPYWALLAGLATALVSAAGVTVMSSRIRADLQELWAVVKLIVRR